MSSLGDAFGQSLDWISGEKGDTTVQALTKNPALQKQIDAGLKDYETVKSSGASALKDYITKYLAGEGAAKTRTGEEIGNLDRYFNGGAASELTTLRNKAYADAVAGNDLASRFYLANMNRSRAGQEGGASSYFTRQALANLAPIQSAAALARDAAARSDWGMLEQARLGLTGQRQNLANSLAAYGLAPEAIRRQMYGQDLGYLGTIGELDRGNKFYGLQYNPSWGEEVGQHVGNLANAAMQAYSMYTGMGGMGGGGTSTGTSSMPQIQWQSYNGPPTSNQMGALSYGAGPATPSYANAWSNGIWNAGTPSVYPSVGGYGGYW